MSSIAQLNTDIADAQSTSSGLTEWNNNSLNAVSYDISYLLLSRGAAKVDNVMGFADISPNEANYCILDGYGLFYFEMDEPASGEYYPALGGGFWVNMANYKASNYNLTPTNSNQRQIISDIEQYPTVPLGGQGLMWDGTKWAFTYIPLYVPTDETIGDKVAFDGTNKVWRNRHTNIVVVDDDHTLEMTDDTVIFNLTTAVSKKAYLPVLTTDEIGKQFTIVNKRSSANCYVDISFNGGVINTISPTYTYFGTTLDKSYHFVSVIWTGTGYKVIKRG